MVFSSITFVFLFLPSVLAAYFLVPKSFRNTVLLAFSLLFYFWGSPEQFYLIIIAILGNYLLGLWVNEANLKGKGRKFALLGSIVFNFGLLFYFKYFNFFMDTLNGLLGELGSGPLRYTQVVLPIGISFFIFQGASYVFDLYKGLVPVQKNLLKFALYKALFPQLIAGPIVRYIDVYKEIEARIVSPSLFLSGVSRFIVGLGKKVIIANGLASVADQVFALPANELTASLAWLGIVAYTFQIYFDFSGYSDMAIGMGWMFGFHFLENFNYPYISRSITEFWRRWHISLSTWFRDYLYIPLGGNRLSPLRTYLNLYVVFALCGIWHGAAWNFLVWGLYHGSLLVLERMFLQSILQRSPAIVVHCYTLLAVIVGWVLFRADNFNQAFSYLQSMFVPGIHGEGSTSFAALCNLEVQFLLLLAGLAATPIFRRLLGKPNITEKVSNGWLLNCSRVAIHCGIFFYAVISLSAGGYNPFIYFRF